MASGKENADNTIIDGFKTVEKKATGYDEKHICRLLYTIASPLVRPSDKIGMYVSAWPYIQKKGRRMKINTYSAKLYDSFSYL